MRRLTEDEGSTLPLILFYSFLSLVLIAFVTAATSLYIERKRLFTAADGAALVGAESFELDDIEVSPDGTLRPRLTSDAVREAARDYLSSDVASRFTELKLERAETTDGRSATVELSSLWRPPILEALLPEGIRIEVTTVARSVFQ